MGRFYNELFDQRQTGDYDDFVEHNKETLDYLLPLAKELIQTIENLVKK